MAVRWPLLVRRVHKWVALVLGVQVVLWTLTGFYMVAVHIDIIHGDNLVRAGSATPVDLAALSSPAPLAVEEEGVREVRLIRQLGRPYWRVARDDGTARLVDAATGVAMPPPDRARIERVARETFAGSTPVVASTLLTVLPQEVASRTAPLWQVEFEGWNRPTFYLSPETGEALSRRHLLWRVFDFAWMLHIMDYDERTDVNNPLLRVATLSAVVMALSGAWLLWWSFPRKKKRSVAI